jgi:hypothetical protein
MILKIVATLMLSGITGLLYLFMLTDFQVNMPWWVYSVILLMGVVVTIAIWR